MVKSMAAYNWQMYSKDEYGTQAPGAESKLSTFKIVFDLI